MPAPVRALGEAKLALLEFLLGSNDSVECAQRALEWLGQHAGVKRALCAGVNEEASQLVGIAGYHVTPERLKRFSFDLDDRKQLLVAALSSRKPTMVSGNGARGDHTVSPLGPGSCMVFPLHDLDAGQEVPVGLLLVSPPPREHISEVRWLAEGLGQKLGRLQFHRATSEAERRFRRERSLLYSIVNAVPDPILLTDTEGRILVANARAEALFAPQEGESEGRRRAVALNNMLFSSALSQTALEATSALRRELLLVDPVEGSDLLFELLSTVATDSREGTGIVSILRNITDLRRATEEVEENYRKLRLAEADVRAERDRLDLIIDSVADPILVTDPAGNIVLMNTPAERLFTARSAALAEELARVRSNDAHFSSFVSSLFIAGEDLRRRGDVTLSDPRTGAAMPVEAISGKILSEHGEVTGVVTILHDLTEALEKANLYEQLKLASEQLEVKVREATAELVRQNELLRRQHIELEQASALKSQFLANMSHEFRTPLNAILGYTSLLLQAVSGELTPQQKRNLVRVDSNARHLLSIINDILDIARIESGKMPLHIDDFALPELIAEVMAEVEPIIARTKLAVESDLAPRLPTVRSDRHKVKQIVLNLLTNALKFTPTGSVKVTTSYDARAGEVAIAVADTGIGIAESDHERIFEDFRQADNSPTREYGGAGLGLAICRRLSAMLGGRIALASRLGKGSTFTLRLPRRPRRA